MIYLASVGTGFFGAEDNELFNRIQNDWVIMLGYLQFSICLVNVIFIKQSIALLPVKPRTNDTAKNLHRPTIIP